MRLQLTHGAVLVLVLVCLTSAARAADDEEPGVEGPVHLYTDDDRVTVVSPAAAARIAVADDRVQADVSVKVDLISAASVDVVTAASPGSVDDTRVEGVAGARWAAARTTVLSAHVALSREEDFRSAALSFGWRRELAQRNTTLDLSYAAGVEDVRSVMDPASGGDRQVHRLTLAGAQLLDERTIFDLVLEGLVTVGYQASPYRTVPIVDPSSTVLYRVAEATPERRDGGAALVRVRHAFGERPGWFAGADYRFYADSWGLTSHTVTVRAFVPLGGRLLLGAEARGYTQGAADFYRAWYVDEEAGAPRWRTRDRALGGMASGYGALTAEVVVGAFHVHAAAGALRLVFDDYPPQAGRTALVTSLGVTAPF